LPHRADRATTARSNPRDTPKNDRNPDTPDLRINNGLLSATWHQADSAAFRRTKKPIDFLRFTVRLSPGGITMAVDSFPVRVTCGQYNKNGVQGFAPFLWTGFQPELVYDEKEMTLTSSGQSVFFSINSIL
jgi:hypothetical protein